MDRLAPSAIEWLGASTVIRLASPPPTDAVARGIAVEQREDPIICQGQRFLRIDSRNLEFAGDAISAEEKRRASGGGNPARRGFRGRRRIAGITHARRRQTKRRTERREAWSGRQPAHGG